MNPASPQSLPIPTHEVLQGLARLHPFVLLADRRGRIVWMSERLRSHLFDKLRASGCHVDEVQRDGVAPIDQLFAHLLHPEQLDALREGLREPRHAAKVRLDLGKGDERTTVEASAFLVEGENPAEPHYVVIVRPEEARERAERALHGELEMLSGILDSSPEGVIAADRSGFITYANPAVERFVDQPGAELVGKPIALFLPHAASSGDLLEKLRHPSSWSGEEIERTDARGRRQWISVSTRPLRERVREGDGRAVGVVTFLRDITKRHQIQEELERKNTELESYVDAVAHDLRSPLVSLLGFTRLLRQDYQDILDTTGHHFLDRVEQAGRTMETLIQDLLELSRIGKPSEPGLASDPRSILGHVEAELKLRLEEQSIQLVLPATPPMLPIDGTRLYQVFANLIGNAVTHMGPCENAQISVEIEEDPDAFHVTVRDNGRGIATEDHERIFEVFQTCHGSHHTGARSPGIGLAIVKKIAGAHGGRAWVESEPGHGARFHVIFARDTSSY